MSTRPSQRALDFFIENSASAYVQSMPVRALDEHEALIWQRTVLDIPAQDAVAENQLLRAKAALDNARKQFTPPQAVSFDKKGLAPNALYGSKGLAYTQDLLTKYVDMLGKERKRRRKATPGLG